MHGHMNVKIHVYCKGLHTDKDRNALFNYVRLLWEHWCWKIWKPLQNFKEPNHCEDKVVLIHAMKAHREGVV
jgi:hypothetical protein